MISTNSRASDDLETSIPTGLIPGKAILADSDGLDLSNLKPKAQTKTKTKTDTASTQSTLDFSEQAQEDGQSDTPDTHETDSKTPVETESDVKSQKPDDQTETTSPTKEEPEPSEKTAQIPSLTQETRMHMQHEHENVFAAQKISHQMVKQVLKPKKEELAKEEDSQARRGAISGASAEPEVVDPTHGSLDDSKKKPGADTESQSQDSQKFPNDKIEDLNEPISMSQTQDVLDTPQGQTSQTNPGKKQDQDKADSPTPNPKDVDQDELSQKEIKDNSPLTDDLADSTKSINNEIKNQSPRPKIDEPKAEEKDTSEKIEKSENAENAEEIQTPKINEGTTGPSQNPDDSDGLPKNSDGLSKNSDRLPENQKPTATNPSPAIEDKETTKDTVSPQTDEIGETADPLLQTPDNKSEALKKPDDLVEEVSESLHKPIEAPENLGETFAKLHDKDQPTTHIDGTPAEDTETTAIDDELTETLHTQTQPFREPDAFQQSKALFPLSLSKSSIKQISSPQDKLDLKDEKLATELEKLSETPVDQLGPDGKKIAAPKPTPIDANGGKLDSDDTPRDPNLLKDPAALQTELENQELALEAEIQKNQVDKDQIQIDDQKTKLEEMELEKLAEEERQKQLALELEEKRLEELRQAKLREEEEIEELKRQQKLEEERIEQERLSALEKEKELQLEKDRLAEIEAEKQRQKELAELERIKKEEEALRIQQEKEAQAKIEKEKEIQEELRVKKEKELQDLADKEQAEKDAAAAAALELKRLEEEEKAKNQDDADEELNLDDLGLDDVDLAISKQAAEQILETAEEDEEMGQLEGYRPLKITYDIRPMLQQLKEAKDIDAKEAERYSNEIKIALGRVDSIIQTFLKIKDEKNEIQPSREVKSKSCFDSQLRKFIGDTDKASQTKILTTKIETDVLILVKLKLDEDDILATAGPCIVKKGRTIMGMVVINKFNMEFLDKPAFEKYSDVMTLLHEIFHALSFNEALYDKLAKDLDQLKKLGDKAKDKKNRLVDNTRFQYLSYMQYLDDPDPLIDHEHWKQSYLPNDLMIPVERIDTVLSIFTLEYIEYVSVSQEIMTYRKSLQYNPVLDRIKDFSKYFSYKCNKSDKGEAQYSSFCTDDQKFNKPIGCDGSYVFKSKCGRMPLENGCFENVAQKSENCMAEVVSGSQSIVLPFESRGMKSRCVPAASGSEAYCLRVQIESKALKFMLPDNSTVVCSSEMSRKKVTFSYNVGSGLKEYSIECPDVENFIEVYKQNSCPGLCHGNGFCSDGQCKCFQGYDVKTDCEEKMSYSTATTVFVM